MKNRLNCTIIVCLGYYPCEVAMTKTAIKNKLFAVTCTDFIAVPIPTFAVAVLSDFEGTPLNFRTKVSVVGSTPTAYKQFKDIVKNYSNDFN